MKLVKSFYNKSKVFIKILKYFIMDNFETDSEYIHRIKKFQVRIHNSENGIHKLDVLKEKCGEIQVTNYGIFEINCLLCENHFKNIRSYTKHILYDHFQCDADCTINSFVNIEINNEDLKRQQDTPINDIDFKENGSSNEDDTEHENSRNLLFNQIIQKVESNNINCMNEIDQYAQDNSSAENVFSCKEDNIDPDNKLNPSKLKTEKKPKLIRKKNYYSDQSQSENNENQDQNTFELGDHSKSTKNFTNKEQKKRKSKSKKSVNEKPVCKICGKQTARYKMRQHLRSHDNSRYVHECKACLKLFISEKSLNFHIKNLHTEEKPFVCEMNGCGKRYVNENALNAHIKRHGERPYTCDICGKGFLYQSRLNEHVNQHIIKLRKETGLSTSLESDEQTSKVVQNISNTKCNIIENSNNKTESKFDPTKRRKFKQKQVIRTQEPKKPRKITVSYKSLEKIICDVCGKETPKANMKQHLRSHDTSRYTYKCDICEKLFISEKSLDLHLKNLHIKDKPFACPFENCEKRFVNENARKSHVIRHTSPREFKCETCNKAFIYQYRLEEHIKTYHVNGRIFGCDLCEKRFFDKHTLERHQVVHSGEKPFQCDECPAKFSRDRSLEWHKKSHTGIKDYICKICGKQYALYNGIYSHMKVHGIKYSIAYEKGLIDGKDDFIAEGKETN